MKPSALSSPLSDSFSHQIQRNGLNIHWTRICQLLVVLAVAVFWLKDVVRLSNLPFRLSDHTPDPDPAVYKWSPGPVLTFPDPFDHSPKKSLCRRFPAEVLDKVQVVLKTGAAEDAGRLRTHLETISRCIDELLIVADYETEIPGHDVHDVLALLPANLYKDEPNFKAYELQKELMASNRSHELDREAGWRLDRFKFLPMVWKAHKFNPDAEWYIFIEPDTFVSWDNLFRLLGQFDPTKPLYMGSPIHSPTKGEDRYFAYGGSGIILSNAAVKRLLARKTRRDGSFVNGEIYERQEWIKWLRDDIYGESVLGRALAAEDIQLSGFFPSFHPLNPAAIPFGDVRRGHDGFWCEPLISMHKPANNRVMRRLWELEMAKEDTNALMYKDLFAWLYPHYEATRQDWDNLSTKPFPSNAADQSPQHCADACEAEQTCLQYSYHNRKCLYSTAVTAGSERRLGGDAPQEDEEKRWVSGWMRERIDERFNAEPCERTLWLKPTLDRVWVG